MATSGYNEGIGILAEFVCTAIPAAPVAGKSRNGRANDAESVDQTADASLPIERQVELRSLNTHELLTRFRLEASRLSRPELRLIHEIALSRLDGAGDPETAEMVELLREAIQALDRSQ